MTAHGYLRTVAWSLALMGTVGVEFAATQPQSYIRPQHGVSPYAVSPYPALGQVASPYRVTPSRTRLGMQNHIRYLPNPVRQTSVRDEPPLLIPGYEPIQRPAIGPSATPTNSRPVMPRADQPAPRPRIPMPTPMPVPEGPMVPAPNPSEPVTVQPDVPRPIVPMPMVPRPNSPQQPTTPHPPESSFVQPSPTLTSPPRLPETLIPTPTPQVYPPQVYPNYSASTNSTYAQPQPRTSVGAPSGTWGTNCSPWQQHNRGRAYREWEASDSCANEEGWFSNFTFFAGLDGAKAPEDLGINGHSGARLGINWGVPLFADAGIGLQIGSGVNFHDNILPGLEATTGTSARFQSFSTVALFQRTNFGLNWAVGYDFRFDDYYGDSDAGQWRMQFGYQLNRDNELGVWGTLRNRDDKISAFGQTFRVRGINQVNLFWRHIWPNEGMTRVWVGVSESHGRFRAPDVFRTPESNSLAFGGDMYIPLNNWLAVFGEAHVITPYDTGTVAAMVGFAITPDGSVNGSRGRFAPMLPLANNTSFPLDLR